MIIPVRCFSCGKPIGHLWEKYLEMSKTENGKKVLDDLGVERICCRGVILSHIDLLETSARFRKF